MNIGHNCFKEGINKCSSVITDFTCLLALKIKPSKFQCVQLQLELEQIIKILPEYYKSNIILEKLCMKTQNRAQFALEVLQLYTTKENIDFEPTPEILKNAPANEDCKVHPIFCYLRKRLDNDYTYPYKTVQHAYTVHKSLIYGPIIILISNLLTNVIPVIESALLQTLTKNGTKEELVTEYHLYENLVPVEILMMPRENASTV